MPHIIAELYREQRALRAEAASIFEAADASNGGEPTAEQSACLEAIKTRNGRIDGLIDDAVAALDTVPDPSGARAGGFDEGRAQGRAAAHAEVVAILEACAAANVKAHVILGFLKARKSAVDVRAVLDGGASGGPELIGRAANSWDEAVETINRRFLG